MQRANHSAWLLLICLAFDQGYLHSFSLQCCRNRRSSFVIVPENVGPYTAKSARMRARRSDNCLVDKSPRFNKFRFISRVFLWLAKS